MEISGGGGGEVGVVGVVILFFDDKGGYDKGDCLAEGAASCLRRWFQNFSSYLLLHEDM